jgi:hypothetical protein
VQSYIVVYVVADVSGQPVHLTSIGIMSAKNVKAVRSRNLYALKFSSVRWPESVIFTVLNPSGM